MQFVGVQARLQFVPEVCPGFGKMQHTARMGLGVDDLSSFWVGEAFFQVSHLLLACVVGQGFHHCVAAGGHHGGIQCVVAVALRAHLAQAPAGA